MDNGPELVSADLAEWAERHGLEPEFIQPGKPAQNSFIERFNRTFCAEVLDFYLFRRLSEARENTGNWLKEYDEQRPHEPLGDLTPSGFLALKSLNFRLAFSGGGLQG